MDLVDIRNWASPETKTIIISQIYLDAPYPVQVREFQPVEGDRLEEKWVSNGVMRSHKIPSYALTDMEKTATMLRVLIERNVGTYLNGTVGLADELVWKTYSFAFSYCRSAKVSFGD